MPSKGMKLSVYVDSGSMDDLHALNRIAAQEDTSVSKLVCEGMGLVVSRRSGSDARFDGSGNFIGYPDGVLGHVTLKGFVGSLLSDDLADVTEVLLGYHDGGSRFRSTESFAEWFGEVRKRMDARYGLLRRVLSDRITDRGSLYVSVYGKGSDECLLWDSFCEVVHETGTRRYGGFGSNCAGNAELFRVLPLLCKGTGNGSSA